MLEMYDFTVIQVRYIKAAMDEIAAYRPDFKTPAEVGAMTPIDDTVRGSYITKKMAAGAARDARNFSAKAIHDVCVDFRAQVQSVYRNNPAVQEQLNRILTKDETFQRCITRGDQTSALWGTLPNVATPPAPFVVRRSEGDVTRAQLDTLISNARAADVALPPADQDFQGAEADLHVKHNQLDDFATAALVQGRSQFAEGSAERELIEAIPTQNPQQPPGQAVITEFSIAGSSEALLKFDAPGGTTFDVLVQRPNDADFVLEAQDFIGKQMLLSNVTTGVTRAKVVPRNSRGTGPESEVAEVTQ